MLNTKGKLTVALLSLYMTLFLINCGGSGGGAGITYDGLTSQVLIDEGNAEAIATNSFQNSSSMRSMQDAGGIFSAVSVNNNAQITRPYGIALAEFVRDFVEHADISAASGESMIAAVSGSGDIDGDCGGYATASGTVDDVTGSFNVTASFRNFCINGNGTTTGVVVTGNMHLVGDSTQANVTISNFSITQLDTGESAAASGSMTMMMNSDSVSINMSMVMRESSSGKTYKVVGLTINMYDIYSNSPYFSMTGRFYDPDYGYADITTIVNVQLDLSDNSPMSGTIVIAGASGTVGGSTKAKLIVLSKTQYQVQADTTGDDSYDYDTGMQNW